MRQRNLSKSKTRRVQRTTSCNSQIKLLDDEFIKLKNEIDLESKFRRQSCEGALFGKVKKEKTLICPIIEVKHHRRSRLQSIFMSGCKSTPRNPHNRRVTSYFQDNEQLNILLLPIDRFILSENFFLMGEDSKRYLQQLCQNQKYKEQIALELQLSKENISKKYLSWKETNYPWSDEIIQTTKTDQTQKSRSSKRMITRSPPTKLINYQKYLYGILKSEKQILLPILQQIPQKISSHKPSIERDNVNHKKSQSSLTSNEQTSLRCKGSELSYDSSQEIRPKSRIAFRISHTSINIKSPSNSIQKKWFKSS